MGLPLAGNQYKPASVVPTHGSVIISPDGAHQIYQLTPRVGS